MPAQHDDDRSRSQSQISAAAASSVSPAEAPTIDVASGEPRETQDSFDEILKRVVQTGPPAEPLGVGSELVGRFLITRVLGEGGMGTVYVARDATLGREVAIKVHHNAGGAHRLRREAVAMARLAHPHVVTVFEVGDLAGRPFVVMEYVIGKTLRAWLGEAPRGVREILDAVVAAGEGLAAAHDAGLVHRDVKPENVLIGADGRARVGDFGLARELDSKDEVLAPPGSASSSFENLMTPVTQTGAVLGTPAYMAPEQFAGAPVDARADQFAYCVTAWEALWKERPFAGASFEQLHQAIARGARRAPPPAPKVPARVRRALERGLSVDPSSRFPTMHALLDAMQPAARRHRRWILAGAALAGAALAAGVALAVLRGAAEPSCATAGLAELAGMRTDLPALLRQRGAPRIAAQAEAVQNAYIAGFGRDARRACEAGRAHDWSPEIVAQSRVCFAIVGRTASLSLAEVELARPMEVLRRIRRLPPEDECRNQTHLASRPPIPSDPDQLAQLTDARAALAVGLDGAQDHELAHLAQALHTLEASPARTDPGIAAGMILLHGWQAYAGGHAADTRKLLVDAYYAGRAIDDEQVSSSALTLLIGNATELGLEPATIKEWLRTALADADRVRIRSPWLAGQVYAVAARAADLGADAEAALTFVARARAVVLPGNPAWIGTFATEGAVKMWSGHVDDGITAYEAAIAQDIESLGPDDPDVAALLGDYAASLLEVERLEPALHAAERATQIIHNVADPDDDRIDPIRVNLAAVLISADHDDEALALLQTARANNVRRLGETNTIVANIDSNLATIYNTKGDYDRSIALLNSALAIEQKLLGAEHTEVASVLYNLAAAYRYKHDYPASIATARRAAGVFAAASPGSDRHRLALTLAANAANDGHDPAQALELTATALGFPHPAESAQTSAWAQLERARALLGVHRGGEARPLLAASRASYDGLHMTQRVQQCDELLAQLPR